jgi:hypothetical protein
MEMTFDQGSWVPAPQGPGHPDWHALRARLHAGYSTRAAVEPLSAPDGRAAQGSFDSRSALALAGFGASLTAVNPDCSEHCNQPGANVDADASKSDAGRGQVGRGLT